MGDDEFKERVLSRLKAIVARLDQQDVALRRVTGKVDRLAVLSSAGEP